MNDEVLETPESAGPPVESRKLFEILVRENADSLMAFLRASVQDQIAADDLFQETMLVAWRKIKDYDQTRPFGAWLRGIAKRLVLAYYRTTAKGAVLLNERSLDYLDRRMMQIDHLSGDTLEEKIAALRECLERLDPAYREPIELHYHQRRTTDWIAEQLAITRDTVQKRLQRARQQLAICFERKAGVVPAE